jgi:hypothetical protein
MATAAALMVASCTSGLSPARTPSAAGPQVKPPAHLAAGASTILNVGIGLRWPFAHKTMEEDP